MTNDINKVILIGYVGNDPQLQFLPNETIATDISFFTREKWTNPATGLVHNDFEKYHIVFFDNLAEIAFEYLREGSRSYIEGKLITRRWKDSNGVIKSDKVIIATDLVTHDDLNQAKLNQSKKNIQSEYGYHCHYSIPADKIFEIMDFKEVTESYQVNYKNYVKDNKYGGIDW